MQLPWRSSFLIITNFQCDDQVKGWKVEARKRLQTFGEMVRQSIMEEMERHAVPEDHWPPVNRIFEQVRCGFDAADLAVLA